MKTVRILGILAAVFGLVLCWAGVVKASAMDTTFTYQGKLVDANQQADGEYDFSFALYDSNTDGNQMGSSLMADAVDVLDGYFTVLLDFNEPNAFTGEARWLEIDVRPHSEGPLPLPWTTLSPRQQITSTPYAALAQTVQLPLDLSSSSGGLLVQVTGSVSDAIYGRSSAGEGRGVAGRASGTAGYGVYGCASNTSDVANFGGCFEAYGKKARAVYGSASNTEGEENFGGYFRAYGKKAKGAYGVAGATDDAENYGGYFEAYGKKKATGVFGKAASTEDVENFGGYFQACGQLWRLF
ncbi:MAG: hypothetical protein ACYST6_11130 [Planctomycetota bacterium]|jgi:hypothetical protein